ncbi:hypothetical protein KMP13_09600 [Epibacterium ulvae]|uniref:hypothetical protein n=1 Tax=Epibacterium ulvae TaxID=1156985 RepID=UPI001BFC23B8|nr:hypothetical protein [Epibacterium ulvae]MBT8154144.1 hypothetical protein [Epibacterium ulvae]
MRRDIPLTLCCTAALASAALACPNGSETLVSCTFEGGKKQLQTCIAGDQVLYRFGATNRSPDLDLVRPVTEVGLAPWPGVSRTIWEEMTFENDGFSYLVAYAQDRDPGTTEISGRLMVQQGEDVLATLTCDPGSVVSAGYALPIFDAKRAAGQHYNHQTYSWE